MRGDFTRFTFDRTKHYRGVAMQQGRVQMDADWNENLNISIYQLQTLSRDVIGECGVPVHVDAFKIAAPKVSPGTFDFQINAGPAGQGRMYVSGLLCEIEANTTYLTQPDWLLSPTGVTPLPGLGPALPPLADGQTRVDLVYLDVWPRTISAVEDPHIREIALGGPDTAERVKTLWQVKVTPGVGANATCAGPGLPATGGGTLKVVVAPGTTPPDPCEPTAQGGYSGPDNRLYRVEVHDPGPLNTATFKWSRDNGSVAASIEQFKSATEVVVRNLGRDDYLKFATGDFVEVSDDATDLSDLPGTIRRITVDEASRTLTLDSGLPDAIWKATGRHPSVRRWDGGAPRAIDGTAQALEAGLQVQFASTGVDFRTGDYWTFAARVVDGSIDPALANPVPPMGIQHAYCSLALITWTRKGSDITATVQDCRQLFPPLTEIKTGEGCCTVSVGDGVNSHGDFTDIQAAVDSLKNGGQVCILAGQYQLPAPVKITASQITISGCGKRATILAQPGAPAFIADQAVSFRLEGLNIQGAAPEGIVQIIRGILIDILDCDISNFRASDRRPPGVFRDNLLRARAGVNLAVNLPGATGPAIFTRESAVVTIAGNVLIGYPAVSLQATIMRVVDNRLSGGGAWLRDGSSQVIVRENEFLGGRGSGVILGGLGPNEDPPQKTSGLEDITIANNEIQGMYSGITTLTLNADQLKIEGGKRDITITGNRITNCQQSAGIEPLTESIAAGGIVLSFASQVRIFMNEISNNGDPKGNTASGIYVFACEEVEISDNEIINNGTAIDDPNLRCITFNKEGEGANPRQEQGATFTILDANGNPAGASLVVPVPGLGIGLDVQDSTEIKLDAPARMVLLSVTTRSSNASVIAQNSDGSSAGAYEITFEPAVPILITGPSIIRLVVNSGKGQTLLNSVCFSATPTSFQAGIAALYVTAAGRLGLVPGAPVRFAGSLQIGPAASIHNNLVLCPLGHALVALAAGPLSVHGNILESHGFITQPELSFEAGGLAANNQRFNTFLEVTGCVCIDELGRALDTQGPLGKQNVISHLNLESLSPLALFNPPDGRVLFHDNQVKFLDPNTSDTKTPVQRGSAILITLGDLSVQDNQFRLENPEEILQADVAAFGGTVRASGNRFEEILDAVEFSLMTTAGSLNTTTNNQSTNCLKCTGTSVINTLNLTISQKCK